MKANPEGPIVVLGAGPTGLGAAYKLQTSSYGDWVLYERDEIVGGLSRSYCDEKGFTWDVGGHVVFSHYGLFTRLLDNLLGSSDWLHHERESWIRVFDTWVPYPFQNNIHRLPPEHCARCLEGLIASSLNPPETPFVNFEEFIARTFGEGIADIFMRPYNRKVWAYSLSKLDAGWIEDRVSVPDAVRVARNAILKTDDVSWGPNNRFRFPKKGGTGAIWEALVSRIDKNRIYYNHKVIEIDTQTKRICFANGHEIRYGTLISTMPLDCLAVMSNRQEWKELVSGLLYSSVHVIGIGLKGSPRPNNETKCWMYFPEHNTSAYRVTHFSFYSPYNVDDINKHWSLMAEVSESPENPVNPDTIVDNVIRGLVDSGLITESDQVTHTWHKRVEYGYPTPSINRDKIINRLLTELYDLGILSRGRFGAWRYEVGNMDHSFMQGWEAASHVLHGTPEITIWHPDLINQPHPVLGWNRFG
jgi:protoporphyrinogen oxidase